MFPAGSLPRLQPSEELVRLGRADSGEEPCKARLGGAASRADPSRAAVKLRETKPLKAMMADQRL